MSKNLEARIEQLERDAGIENANLLDAIIVTFWAASANGAVQPGVLTGYTINGKLIERPRLESEEAFTNRIIAENWQGWPEKLLMLEHRGEVSNLH